MSVSDGEALHQRLSRLPAVKVEASAAAFAVGDAGAGAVDAAELDDPAAEVEVLVFPAGVDTVGDVDLVGRRCARGGRVYRLLDSAERVLQRAGAGAGAVGGVDVPDGLGAGGGGEDQAEEARNKD